jgi:hypothetical protein
VSFADLRQTCLRENVLSTSQFAEERTFTRRGGDPQLIRVKVAQERLGPRSGQRSGEVILSGRHDEQERLLVTFSRDSSWPYALAQPPSAGDALSPAAGDADTRVWAASGETVFQDDQHGVYVFVRSRRVAQGGK